MSLAKSSSSALGSDILLGLGPLWPSEAILVEKQIIPLQNEYLNNYVPEKTRQIIKYTLYSFNEYIMNIHEIYMKNI